MSVRKQESAKARAVIEDVAQREGFDLELLRCRSRRSDLVEARWRAAAAAYELTSASVSAIARILHRHPSSVRHGLVELGVAV